METKSNTSGPILIELSDLVVDPENPRLDESATDERGAIMGIVQDQGDKLANLAEHLALNGPCPFELTLVFPWEDGKYIVAEGNRRTAALKILRDISLIQGADPKLFKRFKQISEKAENLPTSLLCAVEQSEERRNMWLKLRHTGENQGRGLSGWDSKEQARFLSRHDKDHTARMEFSLRAVELVRSRCSLTPDEDAALQAIPITTLERMLGDPDVRKTLGIDRVGKDLVVVIDDEVSVLKALKTLIMEIARKQLQVGKLMTKDNRRDVVSKWTEDRKPGRTGVPMPPRAFTFPANVGPSRPTPITTTGNPPTHGSASPPPPPPRPRMPVAPEQRKKLIPLHFTLKITDMRVKRIFIELKNLDVEDFENAAGVLLRVFLELSVESFLRTNHVTFHENDKLRIKMGKAGDFWEANTVLTKSQITAWRNALSSNDLFSLNVLHAHVHSLQSIPNKKELIKTWDAMELYFKNLWPS